ncbi:S1/P1 nuclease [Aquicella lusitana]|uniref:S1/P1 nuclease n=1 Tax=Aquicella lusitana TaxID=254246 RepID=A0A370GPH2_9COXI|nr:S1/P1 nuclease [Aquicella lusitana]RDI45210.1 S1/P1 nuclease [Aquicella lusitana]VVC72720.1 hypothetical protein AQULUS_04410 [Aquicella lusitana]
MKWGIVRYIAAVFFCSLILPSVTFAWNALGHMVVAQIAYQELSPAARAKADKLVDYFHSEYPEMESFLNIAYWPDAIRSQKIDTYTRWHYIDIAFSNDGTPLKNLIDTDNAVWALNNVEKVVKNDKANPYERARFLAFLVHIVGDLHQPLHTVSYISAAHPDGDKGGNQYFIRYNNDRINLHRLWDGGVGLFEQSATKENAASLAAIITARYPKDYFDKQIDDLNPDNWAQEGVATAKANVYNTPENLPPISGYIDNGKQTAQQRAALAGYRLAVLLDELLS